MQKHGFPMPPRSACVYCPYKSNLEWRETLKDAKAMALISQVERLLIPRGEFLHKSGVAICDVDFSTDEDHGQQMMFGNECEGLCGV